MTSIRCTGLCLAATLIISAVVATSASAEGYGFYKDGTTEAATGYKYKGKLTSGTAKLVTPKNGTIECTGLTSSGEVKSLDDAEGEAIFTGCSFSAFKCDSSGAKEGEIVTKELTVLAVLEKLSGGEKEPALLFKPLKETKVECTGFQKITIANNTGTDVLGGLLVLIPKAAAEESGWLGSEGKVFALEFKQKEGTQEGSGEFVESEAGEIMKAGLTATGEGLKNFKEGLGEEAKLSIEYEKAVSVCA
jgi:hypothetical protein